MGVDPVTLGLTAGVGIWQGIRNRNRSKRDNRAIDDSRNRVNARLNPALDASQGRSNQLYGDLYGRANQLFENPGSGYNSRGLPGYTEFADSGGWDENARGDIEGNISEWANLVRGEGANKTFKEFADTGGYTEADKTNVRGRIAAQTPSFYAGLSEDLRRRSAVNPYTSGLDSASTKLARESSRASADAVREGEIGLSESIRSGRLAGAEGFTSSVLQSLAGKNAARMGMQNSINQGRQFGISGLEDVSGREWQAGEADKDRAFDILGQLYGTENNNFWRGLGLNADVEGSYLDRSQGVNRRGDAASDSNWNSVLNGVLNQILAGRRRKGYGRDSYDEEWRE